MPCRYAAAKKHYRDNYATCPLCKSDDTTFLMKWPVHMGRATYLMEFRCTDCGAEWRRPDSHGKPRDSHATEEQ